MSVKRSKSLKPSKSAKSKKLPINQATDSPLTPLLTVGQGDSMPQIRGNNGNNGNNGKSPVPLDESLNDWNLEQAILLRINKNYSYEQLASHFRVPSSTIHHRMKVFNTLLTGHELKAFRVNRSDLLDSVEANLLSNMLDEDKIKGASLNNLAFSLRQTAELGRLERGQATANVEIHITDDMEAHLDDVATSYSDKLLADAAQSEDMAQGEE